MSRPPETPSQSLPVSAEYSNEERATLLRLAHESIASALEHHEITLGAPCEHLAEPRGAFTTIYVRGLLRGCVGYVMPIVSLFRTVAETARAAAFDDTRFPPLRSDELADLQVSISILSRMEPITSEQIVIGRHGLLVTMGGHRGLLLPQVASERNWSREAFLAQTCRKAGLPDDAWRTGAKIEAFTAEIFADPGLGK